MKELTLASVFALTVAVALPSLAENSPTTRLSLKGLDGIGILVEPIDPQARQDGLSVRAIHSAVQTQLGKAGLRVFTPEQQRRSLRRPCLHVNVATSKLETGEHLYSIQVELTQWVASLANPKVTVTAAIPVPAQTWSPAVRFGIAPAKQVSQDTQNAVGAMVEEFIDAYYMANPSETAFQARRDRLLR